MAYLQSHQLRPDTQVVLLLCGRFGQPAGRGDGPLAPREYDALAEWLLAHEMRPADLLSAEGMARLEEAGLALPVGFPRVQALMGRGGAMALAVESWTNKGLWVISRSDPAYPKRLRGAGRLGPPLLYGVGDASLLDGGGLAVVGSRNIDAAVVEYTRKVAAECAEQGLQVVSGGARGVDTEAMLAALEAGGSVVGVPADSLARSAVAGKYRQALMRGTLVLASPFDPDAGFNVGNAMARNRHIYALADWALVVSATANEGGSWTGAVEALAAGRTPVFVRAEGKVPEGNRLLLAKGARPFPPEPWGDLAGQLSSAAAAGEPGGPPTLFDL